MYVLNRLFAMLAVLFWIATLGAIGWQVWIYVVETAWPILTVRMAFERLLGGVPTFTGDSGQVIFALISGVSLVLVIGLCALMCSALAKLVE